MDQDLVGGAIGRDIVGCWRSLLEAQREGANGCSANRRLTDDKRARRGHNPGTVGSRIAGVRAPAVNSTDGCSSTARAADNTCVGTHAGATGSNPTGARAHADASTAGHGPATCATAGSTSCFDGSATIIPLTGTDAG
jgi:hypothetical protein